MLVDDRFSDWCQRHAGQLQMLPGEANADDGQRKERSEQKAVSLGFETVKRAPVPWPVPLLLIPATRTRTDCCPNWVAAPASTL